MDKNWTFDTLCLLLFQDFFLKLSIQFFICLNAKVITTKILLYRARFARLDQLVDVNVRSSMNGTGNKSKKGPDWQLGFLGGKKLLFQVVSNVRFFCRVSSDPKIMAPLFALVKQKERSRPPSRNHRTTQFPFYYSYNCTDNADGFFFGNEPQCLKFLKKVSSF